MGLQPGPNASRRQLGLQGSQRRNKEVRPTLSEDELLHRERRVLVLVVDLKTQHLARDAVPVAEWKGQEYQSTLDI